MANIESPPQFKPHENRDKISDIEREAFELIYPRHLEAAVNMEDFKDTYGPEEIQRDKAAIAHKKSTFDPDENPERAKRAKLLEAILAEQIELSDWFGENAMTIVPSEFDDLFNGVDLAIEFEKKEGFQYMGLGIDITSSSRSVKEKLERIKKHIKKGDLTQMKYLLSERNDIRGRLGRIPSFVIGTDSRTTSELASLWLKLYRAKEAKVAEKDPSTKELYIAEAKAIQEELSHHRAQKLILRQIEEQLIAFADLARKIDNTDLVKKYTQLLKFIRHISEAKPELASTEKINDSDTVYQAIREGLSKFDEI